MSAASKVQPILTAENVTMRFGGVTAVSDLSLKVEEGSIVGVIGPNGAGKTTVFNVLSGFYTPQEGDVRFAGRSIRGRKPFEICRMGMARTFQNIRLSPHMSVLENLAEYMDEKAGSLPYGAQRRLEIARALATEPRLLLLDEPAAGMNPQESIELMHFIQAIRDHFDLTILLIEHDMKVVMGVCQYIWVMEYGALIAHGDPDAIRSNPEVIRAYLGEDVV